MFGVVEDGVVTVATYGTANLNTGLPVVRETLFQAGSIGKSYTATAIMQLVDDGRLDLDVPLREYLPDLEFADADRVQDPDEPAGTDATRPASTVTASTRTASCGRGDDCVQRYVAGLTDLPLITEPGGLWSYCNSGYIVLGRVVEVLTGMTYEQAITTRILQPLGLDDTLFFPGDMVTHSLAVGHVRDGDAPAVVAPKWEMSRAAGPAGATINTTIDDLLAFAHMHLRGGVAADGTRVLSEASTRAMQQPQASCPEPELLGDHWGLGWFLRTGRGPTVIGHDGNTIGETACLRLIPERDVAWALMMNLSGQNWASMELAQELIDPWLGTMTPGRPEPTTAPVPHADRLVGVYQSIGSRLTLNANGNGPARRHRATRSAGRHARHPGPRLPRHRRALHPSRPCARRRPAAHVHGGRRRRELPVPPHGRQALPPDGERVITDPPRDRRRECGRTERWLCTFW